MMKVVYHTHTYFLDNSIELIKELKNHVDLHVYVEISNESAKSTILDIDRKHLNGEIKNLKEVVNVDDWNKIKTYLDGVSSCKAVLYSGKTIFSIENFPTARKLKDEIQTLNPDVVHFDTISNRCVWIYHSLRKFKLTATLHDPVAHSGEGSWKQHMSKVFFERNASAYFFHSMYAESVYKSVNGKRGKTTFMLGMKTYSVIPRFLTSNTHVKQYILFYGRISPYKGLDILLDAIPNILRKYPNETFLIAGKSQADIEKEIKNAAGKHVLYIDEYLNTEELADIIAAAKFVVCPYKDATQSGVLMTSFALNVPVIATNVGSFPEYIDDDFNGLLCNPQATSLSDAMCKALNQDHYKEWANNLETTDMKKDAYEHLHEFYDLI